MRTEYEVVGLGDDIQDRVWRELGWGGISAAKLLAALMPSACRRHDVTARDGCGAAVWRGESPNCRFRVLSAVYEQLTPYR